MAAHVEYKKDGTVSKMRNHKGNIPILPQTKLCPHCPAKFTRTTHLNRHLRTHSNEKLYHCDTCPAQFTRSDLLTRHKRSCNDAHSTNRTRRKSCKACAESKIKCDLERPCAKCISRCKECVYSATKSSAKARAIALTAANEDVKTFIPSDTLPVATTSSSLFSTSLAPVSYNASLPDRMGLAVSKVFEDFDETKPFKRSPGSSLLPMHSDTQDIKYQPPSSLSALSDITLAHPSSSSPHSSETLPEKDLLVSTRPNKRELASSVNAAFRPLFEGVFSESMAFSQGPSATIQPLGDFTAMNSSLPSNTSFGLPYDFSATYSPILEMNVTNSASLIHPELRPAYPSPYSLIGPSEKDLSLSFRDSVPMAELSHYQYLFFNAFSQQLPIIHANSFTEQGKPAVLLSAMQACGALYVKTKKATQFISNTLVEARKILMVEFSNNPTDPAQQANLLLAVVLLQTIGFFHEKNDLRAASNAYHGHIVLMIQQYNMMSLNAAWTPSSQMSADAMWRDWAYHETIKRCLILSYLLDCCHTIYFALSPSYSVEEVSLFLPCEDKLFDAPNAAAWLDLLNTPSPYGDFAQRITGVRFRDAFEPMSRSQYLEEAIRLSPFAHFTLQHSILRQLFTACLTDRISSTTATPGPDMQAEFCRLQYSLHNWLKSWMGSPDLPKIDSENEEPPFIQHSLQFYWLGQIALKAWQDGLPPFEPGSPNNMKSSCRFQLVKKWLTHIRRFLCRTDQAPTLLWDQLMTIRLQNTLEEHNEGKDEDEGILSFWPDR